MWSLLKDKGILLAISILPAYYTLKLFPAGFLSNDDAGIAISRFEHDNSIFGASYNIAQLTGRFYQTIFYALSQIPYLIPQPLLQFSIGAWRSTFIFLFFLATYQFSKYFFGKATAYLSIFLTTITIDLSGWYNSLVSYPFWISLGISLSLMSAISLDRYLRSNDRREFVVFVLYSLVAMLSYEALFGSLFLYIFVFFRHLKFAESSFIATLKWNKKPFIVYSTMLASYCIVYFLFRRFTDGKYAGTELGALSPKVVLDALFQESLLHSSLKMMFFDGSGSFNLNMNFVSIVLSSMKLSETISAIGLFLAIIMLVRFIQNRSDQVSTQQTTSRLDFIWLTFLFFVPNFLLAISKSRQLSLDNSPYTMSLLSIVFLNLLLAYILKELFSTKNQHFLKRLGRYSFALTLVLILSTSATSQIRANVSYVNDRSEVSQVWNLLQSHDLRILLEKENDTIYSRSIPLITRTEGYPFWSRNLGKRDPNFLTRGTKSSFSNHLEAVKSNCGYILVFIQREKLVKSFQSDACIVTEITLTTADVHFPRELGQILGRGWFQVKVVD